METSKLKIESDSTDTKESGSIILKTGESIKGTGNIEIQTGNQYINNNKKYYSTGNLYFKTGSNTYGKTGDIRACASTDSQITAIACSCITR